MIDHTLCDPSAHTFDAGTDAYQGRLDSNGRTLCNDCGAVMFYCTRDNWYHHAGADVPACFLINEESASIPIPDTAPLTTDADGHAYGLDPDSTWRCVAHGTAGLDTSDCPVRS